MKLDISILLIQINPHLSVMECRTGFWASAHVSASPVLRVLAQHSNAQQCPAVLAWLQLLLWWDLRKMWNCCRAPTPKSKPGLLSLSSALPTVKAADHLRIHNCLCSALCCPLLHSLIRMWYVCKVIGLHYLIDKVGVRGRVREDELK